METGNEQSPQPKSSKPHCPHCENIELRRQGRFGFWQTVVLPRLGIYPWECGLCRRIFLIRQRNGRSGTPKAAAPETHVRQTPLELRQRLVGTVAHHREEPAARMG